MNKKNPSLPAAGRAGRDTDTGAKTASKKLRASQRIRKKKSFEEIFKKGLFFRGAFMNLWILKGPAGRARPAEGRIVVNRKTSPKATVRNLWKRRIREIFRQRQHEILPGSALLIKAKQSEGVPPYQAMEKDFCRLLKAAGAGL